MANAMLQRRPLSRAFSNARVPRPCSVPAQAAPNHGVDRRQALGVLAGLASLATLPAGAATGECELTATASGLQFCELAEGDGAAASPGTLIRAHYAGSLQSSGKQFDSSYDRGRPLTFRVGAGEVIKGWDLGIAGNGADIPAMKAGGRRRLIIPPDLGYGQRGAGGVIPGGATLVFDVQYLGPATGRR